MKHNKLIIATLTLSLLISVTGCVKKDEPNPNESLNPNPVETPLETITDFYDDYSKETVVDNLLNNEYIKSNFDTEVENEYEIILQNDANYLGFMQRYTGIGINNTNESFEMTLRFNGKNEDSKLMRSSFYITVNPENIEQASTNIKKILSSYVSDEVMTKVDELIATGKESTVVSTDSGNVTITYYESDTTSSEIITSLPSDSATKIDEMKQKYKDGGYTDEEISAIDFELLITEYDIQEVDMKSIDFSIEFLDIPSMYFVYSFEPTEHAVKALHSIPGFSNTTDIFKQDQYRTLLDNLDISDTRIKSAHISNMFEEASLSMELEATSKVDESVTTISINAYSSGEYNLTGKTGYYETSTDAINSLLRIASTVGNIDQDTITESTTDLQSQVNSLENAKSTKSELYSEDCMAVFNISYVENYGYFIDYSLSN